MGAASCVSKQNTNITGRNKNFIHYFDWIPPNIYLFSPSTKKGQLILQKSGSAIHLPLGYDTVQMDDRIFLSGGYYFSTSDCKNTFELIPRGLNSELIEKTDMLFAKRAHTLTGVEGLHVFLSLGGFIENTESAICEQYDINTEDWIQAPNLTEAKTCITACSFLKTQKLSSTTLEDYISAFSVYAFSGRLSGEEVSRTVEQLQMLTLHKDEEMDPSALVSMDQSVEEAYKGEGERNQQNSKPQESLIREPTAHTKQASRVVAKTWNRIRVKGAWEGNVSAAAICMGSACKGQILLFGGREQGIGGTSSSWIYDVQEGKICKTAALKGNEYFLLRKPRIVGNKVYAIGYLGKDVHVYCMHSQEWSIINKHQWHP